MILPSSLVDEFAKVTYDPQKDKELTTFYGTAKFDANGDYVLIDGATAYTPATFATSAVTGDRVMGTIKNRRAIVTTNITNPSMTLGILRAINGIIVEGYLTTNANRTKYNDTTTTGLTFSNGGIGAYGGTGKYWYINSSGELYAQSANIEGRVVAKEGFIGSSANGFKIDQYGIYSGATKTGNASGYITLGNTDFTRTIGDTARSLRFAIGSNFGVDASGNLYAYNATIAGKVTASQGKIGNFDINGALYSNNKSTIGSSVAGVYLGSDGIAIGQNSPFKVTSEGILYATGAELSGKVTAGAGSKIGPWTVSSTSIYYGNSSFNNASSLYFGTSGLSIKQNFLVNSSGELTAKAGTIGNWKIGTSSNQADGSLYYGTFGSDGSIYLIPKGVTASISINGSSRNDWVITAGNKFGVTRNGWIYALQGKVGPLNMTSTQLYSNTHTAYNTGEGVRIFYGVAKSGGSSEYAFSVRQGSRYSYLSAGELVVSGPNGNVWISDGDGMFDSSYVIGALYGLYVPTGKTIDSDNGVLICHNGSHIWIGSKQQATAHHTGGTYISSGYNESTSKGNPTIYVSVPNADNSNATNYLVLHSGNYSSYCGVRVATLEQDLVNVNSNDFTNVNFTPTIPSGYSIVGAPLCWFENASINGENYTKCSIGSICTINNGDGIRVRVRNDSSKGAYICVKIKVLFARVVS